MRTELLRHLLALTFVSSLGIVTALACRRVIRRLFGAGAAYSLWLLVPIAMLSVQLPHVRETSSTGAITALPVTIFPLTQALGKSFDSLATAAPAPIDGVLCTVAVWGAGAAIFALYLAGLQRAYVKSLGTLSGLRCVLRAEHSAGCPALIGLLRPKIILPTDFKTRYTRLERLLILSHERTHLRRGDAGWNALVSLMRCIFWFNPLIHVAARYFRFDQELACDAAVLRARRGSRRAYATAMLKTHLTEGALPIGCHWRSAQDLKERMRSVSRRAPNRRRRTFGRALTMLMAAAIAYTAWTAEPVGGGTMEAADGAATSASTGGQPAVRWTAGWAGWLTSPNQAPVQPVIIAMHDGLLFLASGVTMVADADMVRNQELHLQGHLHLMGPPTPNDGQGHPQTTTLEGHVHLTFTGPRVRSASPKTIIVETSRVVLAGQPDGASVVQLDEATMEAVTPPQIVYPSKPQELPELLTLNSITPNFKDAGISQVAAAVAFATHRTFIVDPRVRAQLNMLSSMPVTPEAFYHAFLDILRTRNIVAVPVAPDGNAIRIQPGTNDR